MCRAKSEAGGKRCYSHTQKYKASTERQIAIQQRLLDFLNEREKAAGSLTVKQEGERQQREQKINELEERKKELQQNIDDILQARVDRAEQRNKKEQQRKAEQEAREEARIQRGTAGGGRPRLNLTEQEYLTLKQEAKQQNKTVSRYTQDLLDTPPVFLNRRADEQFKRVGARDSEAQGRLPQSNTATIYQSPAVDMNEQQFDRLTAEAQAFKLTTADYLRRRILGIDPRTRGKHMATERQDGEIEALAEFESNAGLGSNPSSQEIWDAYSRRADEIQKRRGTFVEAEKNVSHKPK